MLKSQKINLEASSLCQLKCPTCPSASNKFSEYIGRGYLKFNSFKNLLDTNPFIKEIELSNFGEIFLNPDLAQIIEYAYEKKVSIRADGGVNLNTVSSGILETLVKYKFKSLTCSIDGASQQTYQEYRVGGNFDKVIDNIKKINEFKKIYNSAFPVLSWQFVIFGHNEHEIPKAKELADSFNMSFKLKLNWDTSFSPVKDNTYVKKVTGLEVVSREEFEQRYGKGYAIKTCYQLWEEPQINWDGKNLGCCWNYWGDFGGNAFNDGLLECLNSEKINYARLMLTGKADPRSDIPCSTCDNYTFISSNAKWLHPGYKRWIYRTAKSMYKHPLIHSSLRRLRKLLTKK